MHSDMSMIAAARLRLDPLVALKSRVPRQSRKACIEADREKMIKAGTSLAADDAVERGQFYVCAHYCERMMQIVAFY